MNFRALFITLLLPISASAQMQCEDGSGRINANCAAVVNLQRLGITGPDAYKIVMTPQAPEACVPMQFGFFGGSVSVCATNQSNAALMQALWMADKQDIIEQFKSGK